jgi:hypothetical protein
MVADIVESTMTELEQETYLNSARFFYEEIDKALAGAAQAIASGDFAPEYPIRLDLPSCTLYIAEDGQVMAELRQPMHVVTCKLRWEEPTVPACQRGRG